MPEVIILIDNLREAELIAKAFEHVNDSAITVKEVSDGRIVIEDAEQDYSYTLNWRKK